MQMLAMVKLRFLNRRRSRSGFRARRAWTTNPPMRATPRTKLTSTGRAGELAGDPHLGERVDQRGQTGGEEGETAEVEAAR